MDDHRFDRLTRMLGRRLTRRTTAATTAIAAAGTIAAALPATPDASAKGRCPGRKTACGNKCVNTKTDKKNCGKCNKKCKGSDRCQNGKCKPKSPCGVGGECRVFVTSGAGNGEFPGLAGADVVCNRYAKDNGAEGNYRAWLSDSTGSPLTRFETKNDGPYVLLDGTVIANNWTELTSGTLQHAIDMTELQGPVDPSNTGVWTNTDISGAAVSILPLFTCNDWCNEEPGVAQVGDTSAAGNSWTTIAQVACNHNRHLYCFEQQG